MLEFFNEKSKDVILNCDGKLIRRALTESSGDVDLQGAEHGPSLIERQNILRAELDIVGKGISKLDHFAKSSKVELLSDMPERVADELRVTCQEILSILARCNSERGTGKRKKKFTIERSIGANLNTVF